MTATNPLLALAHHVVAHDYRQLTPEAIEATKIFVLDSLGVGLAGSRLAPRIEALITAASRWGAGADAALWGRGLRFPAPTAALINAYQLHSLEFDCVHEDAVVHVMATILPVALAEAERAGGIAGRDFVTALALGVDISATIGMAALSGLRFFRPATAGAFGATAALARLRGFDTATLMNAFGLVYSQLAGTMQAHIEGSMAIGLQIGVAARAALTAVDLAEQGMTGPHDVLTGKFGYFTLFETESDVAGAWRELGKVWHITRVAHKPFPSGRATHGAIDGLQRLRAAHDFAISDIAKVICTVPPLIMNLVGRPDIPEPDVNYARLCLAYTAAVTLLTGTVTLADFEAERLRDPNIHALAAKVDRIQDANTNMNALSPQNVTIVLTNGVRLETTVKTTLGSPENPLDRTRHLAKFDQCRLAAAAPLPDNAATNLIEIVDRLDRLADMRALAALLVPSTVLNP